MSEKEWDKFFELMDKIIRTVPGRGTWQDTANEVKRRAEESDADFDEFIGWFQD